MKSAARLQNSTAATIARLALIFAIAMLVVLIAGAKWQSSSIDAGRVQGKDQVMPPGLPDHHRVADYRI